MPSGTLSAVGSSGGRPPSASQWLSCITQAITSATVVYNAAGIISSSSQWAYSARARGGASRMGTLLSRASSRMFIAMVFVLLLVTFVGEALRDGVRRFRGVKRRQELLGIAAGIRVITDFAHHPTAVKVTVTAVRKHFPNNKLYVCFEPRSASSRRSVFQEGFAEAFAAASRVFVAPLFAPEKIPEDQRLDVPALARSISGHGVEATAHANVDDLGAAVLSQVNVNAACGDVLTPAATPCSSRAIRTTSRPHWKPSPRWTSRP